MKINIANNIKTIELLKVELLQKVTDFYGDISAEADCETLMRLTYDAADVINIAYVLAKRLGIDYDDINDAMKERLCVEIEDEHFIERRYGDLSELAARL